MDRREVLLEKNKSKVSVNKESELAVSLSAKTRLLPYGEIDEKLSLIKLYNDERDACNRYRMIFTVNPICTNVLFNAKTEVVRCEGHYDSNVCSVLPQVTEARNQYRGIPNSFVHINTSSGTNELNVLQAIRDTEYSHKDFFPDENPYVYHCGWDIFNNHMIRSDDFVHISKAVDNTSKGVFNTIMDYARDKDGNIIEEKILYAATGTDNIPVKMHVYQYDNILSMYNAFKNRLDERNGWFGFINPGNVEIDNAEITVQGVTKTISLNKMMNNNKSCELYELYPDESLYSFIPKFNKFRNRLEYNWEYDIVYPYENEYDLLKTITGTEAWTEDSTPIKVLSAKKTSSTSGSDFVMFKTMFRHTFKQGDFARLYYYEDDSIKAINRRFKIVKCGDAEGNDADRYFYVRATDMGDRFKFNNKGEVIFTEGSTEPVQFFYKKDVNGYECKYYIRKFKRIKQDGLESEINKLAFGENIYGDRMAQIIFTDDIDVEGLVDNLKRPLSKVYLYMFKTNKGHEKWYATGSTQSYTDEDIEFSHCFGDLTSGLNLTPDAPADYNVRKLHNVNKNEFTGDYLDGLNYVYSGSCLTQTGNTPFELPKPIQSGLSLKTLEDDGFVYGDVVEFDPYYYEETVIENIYHRFNTAQRETSNKQYFDIWDDEIKFDDYDRDINTKNTSKSHEVELTQLNTVTVGRDDVKKFPGNIYPEGYFYNPKTEVKLADVSDTLSSVTVKQVKYTLDGVLRRKEDGLDEHGNPVISYHGNFVITTKYDFTKGDIIALYQSSDGKIYYGFVYGITGNTLDIGFDVLPSDMNGLTNGSTSMLTTREYIAPYAAFLPNSKTFVWRELVKPSELPNDSTLFDRPFANGCFYVHQNVNFFLKRQDPRNEYGLLYPENSNSNVKPQTKNFKMYGSGEIDLSTYNTMPSSLNKICY